MSSTGMGGFSPVASDSSSIFWVLTLVAAPPFLEPFALEPFFLEPVFFAIKISPCKEVGLGQFAERRVERSNLVWSLSKSAPGPTYSPHCSGEPLPHFAAVGNSLPLLGKTFPTFRVNRARPCGFTSNLDPLTNRAFRGRLKAHSQRKLMASELLLLKSVE